MIERLKTVKLSCFDDTGSYCKIESNSIRDMFYKINELIDRVNEFEKAKMDNMISGPVDCRGSVKTNEIIAKMVVEETYPHKVYCSNCFRTITTNKDVTDAFCDEAEYCPHCGIKFKKGVV